ncbi:MAG: tRNA epoxyqueuosine(34) reductase QueG [Ardenticatenaceae bacterium]|nr:tRNA epoxyqueuosine(34) reductase QueG [Anaerolineales bacterium]MCB8921956.1 tRNA epoxyqueuosine(34) reductase QueG [Ardenticatenaceae bacterium]MCB8989532.1 tRNA epoxyqueuosine(34) reductase QueG [Ardenticatenaceae bacterium]MCB9003075.1 tRNA epoxyqueuosine(34) reductase QueG [Ardenticatenaceae bacterium]
MHTTLLAQLKEEARRLGFSMAGVIPAVPARRLDAYMRWVEGEMYGRMTYLARPDRIIRRQDLGVILPGVRSLVCVGLDYYTMRPPDAIAQDPSRGRISNYAWGADYHDVMTPRLEALAAWLAAQVGGGVRHRVYVDTGAILERDHAETAVLGFTGKNTMLIHPRRGSWFFLGEMLTTVEIGDWGLERQSPISDLQSPSCGTCHRCLDACPTHAFPQPYVLDARRCISYLTIELKGWIPQELRPLLGNWIYGCDVCQSVCPFNRFAQPTAESSFYAQDWDAAAPPLLEILVLDEASFAARFAHSPIKRIKRRGLLRNACVAAGNWGSETAVPPLITLLSDPEPLLRGHAAWALRQIGGKVAETAVAQAIRRETDPDVRGEMEIRD